MAGSADIEFPDGIGNQHSEDQGRFARHASPLSILILGSMIVAAFLGAFGGGRVRPLALESGAAQLTVTTPRTLRNGEFFETRISVLARADIADLVIAVPPGLWRDMTINTMIPAASEETFKQDSYRFSYGPLKRGETLQMKIDGQINPPLFAGTRGEIAVLDGEAPIGAIPFAIDVLP
jgi:hypothetical protein